MQQVGKKRMEVRIIVKTQKLARNKYQEKRQILVLWD